METPEKRVIRRFYEIVGSGRPEDLDEVCAPDLQGHAGAGSNLTELKDSTASFLVAFPDMMPEVRNLVQEDSVARRNRRLLTDFLRDSDRITNSQWVLGLDAQRRVLYVR